MASGTNPFRRAISPAHRLRRGALDWRHVGAGVHGLVGIPLRCVNSAQAVPPGHPPVHLVVQALAAATALLLCVASGRARLAPAGFGSQGA